MKRPPSNIECETAVSKRRRRMSCSDDDECSKLSTPLLPDTPPMHRIYNSACRKEKPDELFRKDLISAMKLPDSEQLEESDFWDMSDSWKPEWERGVQVPVNSKLVPNANVRSKRERSKSVIFKQPKKFIRTTQDEFFSADHHVLVDTGVKADSVCKYDMDDMDCEWLKLFNNKWEALGLPAVTEDLMERVIEDFETQCSNRFQDLMKTEKGLGIEYDENIVCDVCKAPDCEEGNEMVFCDACNICVHQACYGIMAIPEGSWVCGPCSQNLKPICVLCPNSGGAMKRTVNPDKWAHVSCALWIPEVSIGNPEIMEPVTKINNIPSSRWSLICTICRERVGACIQCSVKQCKTAYHVTCAFENRLEMEMKTMPLDSCEQGVKMQSFCEKHCKNENLGEKSPKSSILTKTPRRRKKKDTKSKEPESEVDEHNARIHKIRSLEAQFQKFVNVKATAAVHNLEPDVVDFIYCYWVLKRRSKFNRPLLITKCDEANLLIKQHENLLYSRLKMFVHLRQDLERVRNLCYMLGRREKIRRQFLRLKQDIFDKQHEILGDPAHQLSPSEIGEVLRARVGDSVYDKFYTLPLQEDEKEDVDEKSSVPKLPNPYAKSYTNSINTRSRRRVSQSAIENRVENSDLETGEMPKLEKCKSEENISTLTENNLSAVNKLQSKKISNLHRSESKLNGIPDEFAVNGNGFDDPEMPKICPESITLKIKKHAPTKENSNSKSSLSQSSDKENFNSETPVKHRKTRSQHLDFKPSDMFGDDGLMNDVSMSQINKLLNFDHRSTRYHMRTRLFNNDVEILTPSNSTDVPNVIQEVSPKNADTLLSESKPNLDSDDSTIVTPPIRRKRGRPKKIIIEEITIPDVADNKDSNDSGTETIVIDDTDPSELDEGPSFRMSLRHIREAIIVPKKTRGRKKMSSSGKCTEDLGNNHNRKAIKLSSFSEMCNGDASKSSVEESPPERIVIRLRKDPTQDSVWKNESSCSSDAFHIVRDEMSENLESPSDIEERMISDEELARKLALADDCDGQHRYMMRNRSCLSVNYKS